MSLQDYRNYKRNTATESTSMQSAFKTLTPDPVTSEEAKALRRLLTSERLFPYPETLFAFRKGVALHTGLRKGGAPEFSHQVAMATFFLNQMAHLKDARPLSDSSVSRILSLIFLHDAYEDGLVSEGDLIAHLGSTRTNDVVSISKIIYHNGRRKTKMNWPSYRAMMLYGVPYSPEDVPQNQPINHTVVLVKGIDRLHNLSCCYSLLRSAAIMRWEPEYWTRDRVRAYAKEAQECHIPLLQDALNDASPDIYGLKPYLENVLTALSDLVKTVQAYVR